METASVIFDQREVNQGHCHQCSFLLVGFFREAADFGGELSLIRVPDYRNQGSASGALKVGIRMTEYYRSEQGYPRIGRSKQAGIRDTFAGTLLANSIVSAMPDDVLRQTI